MLFRCIIILSENPSPVLERILLSIVHLHSNYGKVTFTTSLVGLGRHWFALCSAANGRFAPGIHHMDAFPVSYTDVYLYGVCGRHNAGIQYLPPSHRALADFLLHDPHPAPAMDPGDRPARIARGTIFQRRRPFVFLPV